MATVVSLWIDKGLAMVVAGFVPNPMGRVSEYAPSSSEVLITLGIYAFGGLVLTVLYRMALHVRTQETQTTSRT